jgi:beta-glucanase (GH16 family)
MADKASLPTTPSRPRDCHESFSRPRPPPPLPFVKARFTRSTPNLAADFPPQRIGSPLTLQRLGSDYTRYFSPVRPTYSAASHPLSSSLRNEIIYSSTPNLGLDTDSPFSTPNTSTTKLAPTADVEKNNFLLVDDRLAAPYDEKGALAWPLFGDKEEDDDDLHMPRLDDDVRFRTRFKDRFTRDNITSTIGLVFMVVGLSCVFIALPVLSATGVIDYNSGMETPLDQMPKTIYPPPETWATVNDRQYPLLRNVRSGLIDPDTPDAARKMQGAYGDEYELVFSDEFNDNNRTFYEGDEPYWYAPDFWYGATQDLEWYDPDAVTTWDGTLELRLDQFMNHGLNYRSGMLNSWNRACFKGGIFEVSMSLPGPAAVRGLWPGAWTMGNLGRPGYLATSDGLWPYTYQACDVGITPNQSSYDGLSHLPGQRLNSCTCPREDHPTPGTGRGAPEIDIAEGGASWNVPSLPIVTQSYQVAPFDVWYYPDYEFTEFPDFNISYTNGYTGGPFQQAVSATTNLNRNWYDGKQYQKYSFEYVPGEGEGSYIHWKVGGQTTFVMDGRAIGRNGNISPRQVTQEPMSMILNLGISNSWTAIDWANLVFPAVLRVDYVRWYQKKGERMVTCDPPGFETTQYIKDHAVAYTNPNLTVCMRFSCEGHY